MPKKISVQLKRKNYKVVLIGRRGLKGDQGEKGDPGIGLPSGGLINQIPAKASGSDYDVHWIDIPSAPVSSVNGKVGSVVLDASDIGAEDVSNKSADGSLGTSDTLYPTQKAVKTYVDNSIGGSGNIELIQDTVGSMVNQSDSISWVYDDAGNKLYANVEVDNSSIQVDATNNYIKAKNNIFVYNVKDYGATGNGTTDDTSAIQSALNAIPSQGGVVYFPQGTYIITDTLTIKSYTTVLGAGTNTIVQQQSTNKHGFYGADKVKVSFQSLAIYGPGSGVGTGKGIFLERTGSTAASNCAFRDLIIKFWGSHGFHGNTLIASVLENVRVDTVGGHGFLFDSNTTSTSIVSCYAVSTQQAGFVIQTGSYNTFTGCAVDSCGMGYLLDTTTACSINGSGCEIPVNRSVSYPGVGYKINAGSANVLNGIRLYQNISKAVWITGNSTRNTVIGLFEDTPQAGATASIQLDSGSSSSIISPAVQTAMSLSGTYQTSNNTNAWSEQRTGTSGTARKLISTGSGTTIALDVIEGAAIDVKAEASLVTGDSSSRFTRQIDGKMEWGNGSSRDTNLYRNAANELKTDDKLVAALGVDAGSNKITNVASGTVSTDAVNLGQLTAATSSRIVQNVSSNTTMAAASKTDYAYFVTGSPTITQPTAVGNTNKYTIVNAGSGTVSLITTGSETISGSTTITLLPGDSITNLSNGTNWYKVSRI